MRATTHEAMMKDREKQQPKNPQAPDDAILISDLAPRQDVKGGTSRKLRLGEQPSNDGRTPTQTPSRKKP